jgi:hypothetical protein
VSGDFNIPHNQHEIEECLEHLEMWQPDLDLGDLEERRTIIDEGHQIDFVFISKNCSKWDAHTWVDTDYSQTPQIPRYSKKTAFAQTGSDHFAIHATLNIRS